LETSKTTSQFLDTFFALFTETLASAPEQLKGTTLRAFLSFAAESGEKSGANLAFNHLKQQTPLSAVGFAALTALATKANSPIPPTFWIEQYVTQVLSANTLTPKYLVWLCKPLFTKHVTKEIMTDVLAPVVLRTLKRSTQLN
jgi:hypothetical protein